MLKKERMLSIIEMVDEQGFVTVDQISTKLNVSNMTIRRDLEELSKNGQLERLHGGAQRLQPSNKMELSHLEKKKLYVEEKKEVAALAASLIEEDDTVFLGPGTTVELLADYMQAKYARIVTNSLPVFECFREKHPQYELLLIGGSYRARSGAFIGSIAVETLEKLRMTKTFVSVNGILDDKVSNANPEEGRIQSIALDNAKKRYVIADHHKMDKEDFYGFYSLNQVDGVIIDSGIDEDRIRHYKQYTEIITNR